MEPNMKDTTNIEISYAEMFEIVVAMEARARMLLSRNAPKELVNSTVSRVCKFNDILRSANYDHLTKERLQLIKPDYE